MVRILFVRHGMTESNLADARMAVRVAKGQVQAEDVERVSMQESLALGPSEACGDTALSSYKGGGVAEAGSELARNC